MMPNNDELGLVSLELYVIARLLAKRFNPNKENDRENLPSPPHPRGERVRRRNG